MKVAQTTTEQISVGNCLEDLLGGMLEEKIIETIGNAIPKKKNSIFGEGFLFSLFYQCPNGFRIWDLGFRI